MFGRCFSLILLIAGLLFSTLLPASAVQLTPQEQRWIAANPEIYYTFVASWPLDYQEDGQHIGLSRDYLNEITRLTGLRFVLAGRDTPKPHVISAITPELVERDKLIGWRFSQRWHSTNALIISHNGASVIQTLDQLSGKRVAVRRGTFYESWLRHHRPDILLLPLDHTREVFEAVHDDRAEFGLGSDLVMRPLLYRFFSHKLAMAGQIPELMAGVSMGISEQHPLLLSVINKALAAIPVVTANDIFNRWAGEMKLGYPSVGVIFSLYQWEIITFFILLLLLGWLLHRAIFLRRQAIAGEKRKTQFLAMMSHEIRTPMNALIASLELLNRPAKPETHSQYLALANSSASNLLGLLNDILDHSKLSQKRITLENRPFMLGELVNAVCDSYRPLAEKKQLALVVNMAEELHNCWVESDAHRLRQIINNLLSNAIKFTEQGVITLTLDVTFSAGDICMLTLAVADTGIGISSDAQRTLFDAWTQVDNTADRHYSGSGLGLWICWQLTQLMRGSLVCSSEPGAGSIFTLRLPLRLCQEPTKTAEVPLPVFARGTSVLLVEDHPAAQRMLTAQLHTLGCEVELAENGQQALTLLDDENYYDVVLLDINLPDISGYDVARHWREIERERGNTPVPLVAISAMNDAAHHLQSEKSGIDAQLSKPIILPALGACLKNWCEEATTQVSVPSVLPMDDEVKQWLLDDLQYFDRACQQLDCELMQHHAHRLRGAAQMYQLSTLEMAAAQIEAHLRAAKTVTAQQAEAWLNSIKTAVISTTRL
jgi:two-component system, NarL family, sensor histidine kinase EvgS